MSSGKIWDDLGSTAFVNTDGPDKAKSSTDNAKRTALRKRIDESSDDELDFLSSGSRSDDVIPTRNKPRAKKKQPGKAFAQGQEVDHHPDYPPPKMKFPDFKKITHAAPEEGSSSTPRSKTSKTKQKTSKQTKEYEILATLHDNENKRHPALSDGLSSDKDLFHVSPQQGVQQFPGLALSPLRGGDQGTTHLDTPRSNTEDAISYRRHKRLHNKTTSYSLKTNNRSTPTSIHASRIRFSDSSDSSEATPRAKHPKTRLRKFPTLDPLSVSDSMAPELDRGKGKAPVKGATSLVPSQTHRRIHSDTMTPRKNSKSRYPFPSPLSSPAHQLSQDAATVSRETNSHGSRNITAAEDADDESQKRLQLQPFPMAASQPNTGPRRTVNCAQPTYSHNNRNNPFSSDLDVFGDDSLLLGESVDPSSLCPFCDEKLPLNPSPFYRSLLEAARRKARPDPRPTNPHGLKVMMGIYVESCKRHRFEAHQIPEAMAKGWPTDINFGKVRGRVERLAGDLAKLVRNEGNAREESIYWTIVTAEIRKMGSRAASGVKGQFESFEKTQPGYYGELGSMILHQTLYNMFPPTSFEPQSITPLTPQDLIQRILVPEAALALIMEDTGQEQAQAVQTMRESAGYGVAMFPDTSEGPGVGAGEDIVLERARARRRELEDEERMEALSRPEDSEYEHAIQTQGTKRLNMLSSAATLDVEEATITRRTRMKRKKASSRTDAESGSDGHLFPGGRAMSAYKNTRAVSPNLALDPSPPQSSPPSPPHPRPDSRAPRSKGKSTPSIPYNSSRRRFASAAVEPGTPSNGSDSIAPIDSDDLQVIDIIDGRSSFKQQPPVPANRKAQGVQGSSNGNGFGGYRDPPKLKPKPRRLIAKRKTSVERSVGPSDAISSPTEQNQWRDSSVEIIDPPPIRNRPIGQHTPGNQLDENTGGVHTNAQQSPAAIGTSNMSSRKYESHDWLMNDSD